jgi:phosphoserine aminotransferase
MLDWHGTGQSVMEMSHRGKDYVAIAEGARDSLRKLLEIPDTHQIFFFQGGACMQFAAIPFNLSHDGLGANYLTTGTWSETAIKEAQKVCKDPFTEIATNIPNSFAWISEPEEWNIRPDAAYFHYCDNETIQGFEWHDFPFDKVPENQILVCDMSSNFCSRPVDWSKFGVVYAGAQKNVGPAGVCIAVIRKDLLGKWKRSDMPMLFDWELFNKAPNTFHNTPCTWSIYVAGLNIDHMLSLGGIPAMQELAAKRSGMLYDYIDNSDGYYSNPIQKRWRSRMNIPFRVCCNPELETKFVKEANAAGLLDLAGHRSVGGCRASLYNAMPVEGVEALIDFMNKFKKANPKPQ